MGLDHLDTVTLFVHKQTSLLAFDNHVVLVVLSLDFVVTHLGIQVRLVVVEQATSLSILLSLLFLLLLLLSDDGEELLTLDPGILLHSRINVSKLLLTPLMECLDVSIVFGLLFFLLRSEL